MSPVEFDPIKDIKSAGTIPEILTHHYRMDEDRTALIFLSRSSERCITFGELIESSLRYAELYRAAGLESDDVIVTLLPPGPDLVFSFFGAMFLGAIPSILPFPTEKLDPERYRQSLLDLMQVTKPAALVAQSELASELREKLDVGESLKRILEPTVATSRIGVPVPVLRGYVNNGTRVVSDRIALLQHSSGTTGLQKGVALSHQAILNQLYAYGHTLKVSKSDVVVSWLPLYHDMGLIAGFLMPLLFGIKLVLISPFEWVRAPWLLLEAVDKYKGTLSWLPNFAYNFCAQRIPKSRLDGIELSSWRAVINCSEPMYAESHHMFAERFQEYGLSRDAIATCYAMAENVFAVTQGGIDNPVAIDRIDAECYENEHVAKPVTESSQRVVEMVSAGPPLANVEVTVFSEDYLQLPERKIGELALRSNCMLTGYYNRPDATHEAFKDGWYLTGDLGYVAAGEVYITGRKKDLIIVGGKNIYPHDLEQLINQVPGVYAGRAVVFGVLNERTGTEDVIAVVETDSRVPFQPDRLKLAIFEAVARGSDVALSHVKLVDDRWLIKTSSGKLSRKMNRQKYLAETAEKANENG